ncbi:MAG: hypothetical protein KY432_06915 [Acidobacteria bacterium]|nr:hypothetical protein [Acidobacteriota bacterium]
MRNSFLLLIVLLGALPATAEWSRAQLFGADVRSLVIAPDDADRMFLGTSHGEVYSTTDGGRSWINPRGSLPFPGYVVDNLLIDETGRLWMSGWGVWGGGVVAYSEDGGITWTRRDSGIEEVSIRAVAVSPNDPDLLVAGGLTGVWKSTDRGLSWRKISSRENVESLAIDPRSDDTIFIGTWRQAWRTDDGGKRWKHIAEGMVLDTDDFSIDIDPKNPDDIWLSTSGCDYNTRDRGENWTRYKEGFENRRIHTTARDVENPGCVYAGSVAGLYRTLDSGKSWARISDDRLVINTISIHPDRPERIVLGTEGDGVYISYDRGETYERRSDGLYNVRIGSVVTDPDRKGTIYAVVRFAGSSAGIYRSTDGGERWSRLNETPLPEILSLVVRSGGGNKFVAGTERGFFYSSDGSQWFRAEPTTLPSRVEKILEYSSERLFAATSDGVFTSRDAGSSWYRLGQPDARVMDLAVARHEGSPALFALTSNTLVRFTQQGWKEIEGAPGGVRLLAVGSGQARKFLVAGSRSTRSGQIDHLDRWKNVEISVPEDGSVHAVEGARKLVFFASDGSRHLLMAENGQPFAPTGLSLKPGEITFVAAERSDPEKLYVGTTGQGLLVFDPRPGASSQRLVSSGSSEESGTK